MALIVGSATVATGMSPIVEGALYADQIFIDGVSFTSKYDIGSAGQIQVEKYSTDSSIEAKVPGSNFTDTEYANTVININCNNSFQKSQKVPAYLENTMPTSVLMNKTWDVSEAVRVGRQKAALAVLAKNGTASLNTDEVTASNIKQMAINHRGMLRKKNAMPNVVICSVDVYSAALEAAGKDFTPMYNDDVVRQGKVGMWLGMLWIEASLLDGASSYKYLDGDGATQTVSVKDIDFIMYDYNAFSIIDKLTMLRVKDSEQFAGSKVQEEIDTGFCVTNSDCVVVKSSAASG